ncbi:MAG TPA: DNA-directed DNA polymerase II small subunit, partial [Candidatus Thermoplasmatota archaeon]|nr:DNA-directed DNA polymerase II small subunit [Candidatus Thermoplasmatota archaeon]
VVGGPAPTGAASPAAARPAVATRPNVASAGAATEILPVPHDAAATPATGPLALPAPARRVAAPPGAVDSSRFGAYAHQVEILSDVTGNSTCEGDIQDFAKYFNDRLNKLRKLLRTRREMAGMIPIKSIRPGGQAEVKIAGIVTEVRQTKNGHRLIEIEDDTGTAAVLALQSDHRLIEEADLCLDDEVVGIIAKVSTKGDLLILQQIIRPDVPFTRDPRKSSRSSAVAFISDIHFGSKTFLADDWERFVRWINGEFGDSSQRALAEKTKYLVVCGDVVDGIGIFPGQEEELAIDDGLAQYDFAGEQFARIKRPDLKIIVQPGNHDLVRPAEPQPAFPTKYRRTFPENVTFVGNPCRIAIEGVEILGYHGMSFVDWITRIPGLSFEDPVRVMKEMVTRRHVAPIYGLRTPLAPEHKDYLAMDFVPDIFETGHVHAAGMELFRGIHLINSSCWQSQTAYQKMHGFQPEPARVPIVELDTGTPHFLDFHGGRAAGVDVVGRSAFGENWKDKTMGGGQWQT